MIKKALKNSFIILLITCFLLIGIEASLRVLYYQHRYNSPNKISLVESPFAIKKLLILIMDLSRKTRYSASMATPDTALGYTNQPGTYSAVQTYKFLGSFFEKERKFSITINQDGSRKTSNTPPSNLPQLWFFGGSFTFGAGLDDDKTFPWLIQEKVKNKYTIKNWGVGGYGTLHNYIQLKTLLNSTASTPYMAIFVYSPFHLPRNVANPSRLALSDTPLPRATRSENSLKVEMIPPLPRYINQPNFSMPEMVDSTKLILIEILNLCNKKHIIPILAIQTFQDDDPIPKFARTHGFQVVDISLHLTAAYRQTPFDPHPNEKANKIYATKFLTFLNSTPSNTVQK